MTKQEEFTEIYKANIKREGADALLAWLSNVRKSDFFSAPASTRFHGSHPGGLCEHSIDVYHCLSAYLARERVREQYKLEFSEETIAITALLHDVCKINIYKPGTRNVKDKNGVWQSVPTYEYNDELPYGHGEKSVYIISGFMKLTRDEAFAIRYHMGFGGTEDKRNISDALRLFPLSFALNTADMEASLFLA